MDSERNTRAKYVFKNNKLKQILFQNKRNKTRKRILLELDTLKIKRMKLAIKQYTITIFLKQRKRCE